MSDIFEPISDVETTTPEDVFAELVGEGKKFADAQALAKSKWEADRFIRQLEKENEELRQTVGKQSTVEEIMTQIKSMSQAAPQIPQAPASVETDQAPNADALQKLFQDLYAQKKTEEFVSNNRRVINDTLEKEWGSDAQVKMNDTAKRLGVTLDYLKRLGEDSPALLFATLGINPGQATRPSAVPPVNRQGSAMPAPQERTKSYYDKLKATNPTEYFSAKTQQAYMKDAMRLGEGFFDN